MKKTQYLLLKKQPDGSVRLEAVTQSEWNETLSANRLVSSDQRRHFIVDCIEDGNDLDCMYIEVSPQEHRSWNIGNTMRQKNRKRGQDYTFLPIDASIREDLGSIQDSLVSDCDLERLATDNVLMDELRKALRAWRPWAEELLDIYLNGGKHTCTPYLIEKYKIGERGVQKRKVAFEKFILNFLKK